ncbi:MAG: tetratricopeptide repeat protein [Synechococcales bacterium]|nr:tetratricopeptide repeat protein [Synechococcales bacterium]
MEPIQFSGELQTCPPIPSGKTAVVDTLLRDAQALSPVNQATYQRLQAALHLNLRRQIFVAICDDLVLRDRLTERLQAEHLSLQQAAASGQGPIYPKVVTLRLDLTNPNPIDQISRWLAQFPPPATEFDARMPAFQIVGIETLSRQPAANQWLFLTHLQEIERNLPALESSLLLWVPRPWGRMIPQSAPNFWRCRSAVFEFEGDPTPLVSPGHRLATQRPAAIQRHSQQSVPPSHAPAMPVGQPVSEEELALLKAEFLLPPSHPHGDRPHPSTVQFDESLFDSEPLNPAPDEPDFTALLNPTDEAEDEPENLAHVSDRFDDFVAADEELTASNGSLFGDNPAFDRAMFEDETEAPTLLDAALTEDDQETELMSAPADDLSDTFHDLLDEPVTTDVFDIDPPASGDRFSQATPQPQGEDTGAIAETDFFPAHPAPGDPSTDVKGTSDAGTPLRFSFVDGDDEAAALSLAHFIRSSEDEDRANPSASADPEAEVGEPGFDTSEPYSAANEPMLTNTAIDSPVDSPIDDLDEPTVGATDIFTVRNPDAPTSHSTYEPAAADAAIDSPAEPATDRGRAAERPPFTPMMPANGDMAHADYPDDTITALLGNVTESLLLEDAPDEVPTASPWASPLEGFPAEEESAAEANGASHLDEEEVEVAVADAAPLFLNPVSLSSLKSASTAQADAAPAAQLGMDEAVANDPHARSLLQQISGLQQQQAPAMVLAGAYRALGNLYRDRIEQGDIAPANLLRAMKAYEQVLRWVDEQSPMWAEVLNDMGNLCWLLSRCAPSPEEGLPHLQQGIHAYQLALTKINPQTHPQTYPMIQNNLGAAYGDLARYQNPTEHLQKSIDAYQEALKYRRADQDPLRYASTQNNLGTTYWNLAQHRMPLENLKRAIAAYGEALSYYQPNKDPLNYAMIQNNLGTAYWNLAQHEQSNDWLQRAINAYRQALEYRTLETAPAAFAATQNNLGTAYWHIATNADDAPQVKLECLRQAVRAYESALKAVAVIRQSNRPIPLNFDVMATHNNLGLVQYQVATHPQFDSSEEDANQYLEAALDQHLTALHGWQGRPELRQTALNCLVQTLQAIYAQKGLVGQNLALSKIPGYLLPEILPKL